MFKMKINQRFKYIFDLLTIRQIILRLGKTFRSRSEDKSYDYDN